uniref:Uncharacterized protein n=1 Tax=Anguilla anguilla TaxID=7936 RepID=A0A0E9V1Y9_ANGAN
MPLPFAMPLKTEKKNEKCTYSFSFQSHKSVLTFFFFGMYK